MDKEKYAETTLASELISQRVLPTSRIEDNSLGQALVNRLVFVLCWMQQGELSPGRFSGAVLLLENQQLHKIGHQAILQGLNYKYPLMSMESWLLLGHRSQFYYLSHSLFYINMARDTFRKMGFKTNANIQREFEQPRTQDFYYQAHSLVGKNQLCRGAKVNTIHSGKTGSPASIAFREDSLHINS